MVCVGESLTLPEAWDEDVKVRVELPAVAVIVTAVAFVVCQWRVTLCPALIEFTLAEKMRVGAAVDPPTPLQALSPHKASGIIPLIMQRTLFLFICLRRLSRLTLAGNQMPFSEAAVGLIEDLSYDGSSRITLLISCNNLFLNDLYFSRTRFTGNQYGENLTLLDSSIEGNSCLNPRGSNLSVPRPLIEN